jgi:hypothetical protein
MRNIFWGDPFYWDEKLELQEEVNKLREELSIARKQLEEKDLQLKEYTEDKKVCSEPMLPTTITTNVNGILGLEKGSIFTLNKELNVYEHNWSNENVTKNVSFSANLLDSNIQFFQVID